MVGGGGDNRPAAAAALAAVHVVRVAAAVVVSSVPPRARARLFRSTRPPARRSWSGPGLACGLDQALVRAIAAVRLYALEARPGGRCRRACRTMPRTTTMTAPATPFMTWPMPSSFAVRMTRCSYGLPERQFDVGRDRSRRPAPNRARGAPSNRSNIAMVHRCHSWQAAAQQRSDTPPRATLTPARRLSSAVGGQVVVPSSSIVTGGLRLRSRGRGSRGCRTGCSRGGAGSCT